LASIVALYAGNAETQAHVQHVFKKGFTPVVVLDFGINAHGTARFLTGLASFGADLVGAVL